MRPRNQTARDRLHAELQRGPEAAAQLALRLGVSVPTVLRMLNDRADSVVRIGATNRARYALRRTVRGRTGALPLFRIDQQGKAHDSGQLELIQPYGSVLDLSALGWPIDTAHRLGKWDGLPYPLYDMRPQGFLGRQLARHIAPDWGIHDDPKQWSDDTIVEVLTHYGVNTVGNFILGERAYEAWAASLAQSLIEPLPEKGLAKRYATLATEAMLLGIPGSSAAGEFPKFTAARTLTGAATAHVIVKFSGTEQSATAQRWSDLLVCEHLALTALAATTSLRTAASRILQAQDRTLLEIERFDRHGANGRSAVISLASLNECFLGATEPSWPAMVEKLTRVMAGLPPLSEVKILWWFGRLIANTDMHTGNLSFTLDPAPGLAPQLHLAPAYDMLPMLYAPLTSGDIPARKFDPPLPLPADKLEWHSACRAALLFWREAASNKRISELFRAVCRDNAQALDRVSQWV